MIQIQNTGERILLKEETPLMIARHFCAYKFSKEYVQNKSVLELGSGEGYGTYFLSEFAKEITGLDYDLAIIDYAKSKYQRKNLVFHQADIRDLKSFHGKFGVICSFQVIEHLQDPGLFLENVKRLLDEEGFFICSTPNKLDASPNSEVPLNKFHIKEYLKDEFASLLEGYFSRVELYGLERSKKLNFYRRLKKAGIFNFLPDALNPVKRFYQSIDCQDLVIVKDKFSSSLDFIAVCKK